MWDLSILGVVPGMRVAAPRDATRLRELLREAVADDTGPTALRFPKAQAGAEIQAVGRIGGTDVLRAHVDADVLIVSVGALAPAALDAAERLRAAGVAATVVDPRWLTPVDPALVRLAGAHRLVVTVEDGGVAGGYGDAFARALRDARLSVDLLSLGLPQQFLAHGKRDRVLAAYRLDGDGIATSVVSRLADGREPVSDVAVVGGLAAG